MSPLRIKLDGDTSAIPVTPDSLTDPATLVVDDRVRTELSGNRLVVLGRVGGLVLSDASTSLKGIVELATDAETITGTDAARAVTPAALAAALADSDVREAMGIPYAQAAGVASGVSVAAGGSTSVTITLPSGRFGVPPIIGVSRTNDLRDITVGYDTVTTTSFTLYRGSVGNARSGVGASWTATQMTSGSAAG